MGQNETETLPSAPKLTAFYLSRDRVLSLVDIRSMSQPVIRALQGDDVPMSSAILSNAALHKA
jgi:hypothetical protein